MDGMYEKFGVIRYYKDGVLHRDDGPAIVDDIGMCEWWREGVLHREDGPAIECKNFKAWYKYGKLHKEDGPAVIYRGGESEWYINDVNYSEGEFNHWLEKRQLNERLHIGLDEKPRYKKSKI